MYFRSIRFRLTAWYFVSIALVLALFGIGAWLAMRASLFEAVDHDLGLRVDGVRDFLDKELNVSQAELMDEFREQSLLGMGGGLFQVFDENGSLLYRSPRFETGRLAEGKPSAGDPRVTYATRGLGRSAMRTAFQTVVVKGHRFTVEVAEPLHEFAESLDHFEDLLWVAGPFLLLASSLGGFWLSTRALSPVDRISRDARRISINNLSERLQVPRAKDELQRLAQTLNEMVERIERAVKRIVQFTADASHELRAPLTLIHTAAEFSLRRERTPDELTDAMRKILRESERTAHLVDNLLVLARADSGMDDLHLAPMDLAAAARNAGDQAITLAEPKRVRVSTDIASHPVIVSGDEDALARMFLILLDNSIKYTNEGGEIRFRLFVSNSHVEATVSDTGIGIAAGDLPHIYDRFWRADKVRSRNMGGAGLGLSIARWIVERHGGRIDARSEPGRGSEFTVRLPLDKNRET